MLNILIRSKEKGRGVKYFLPELFFVKMNYFDTKCNWKSNSTSIFLRSPHAMQYNWMNAIDMFIGITL